MDSMHELNIFLVDENPLHALAITSLRKAMSSCRIGVFSSSEKAIASESSPDLILLNMSADQSFCANRQLLMILEHIPEVPVMCYSSGVWLYRQSFSPYQNRIIRLSYDEVLSSLEDFICNHDVAIIPEGSDLLSHELFDAQFEEIFRLLTPKEHEVFCLIGKGKGSPEIAEALGCKKNTVDSHLKNIRNKLRSAGAAQLRVMAASIAQTNSCKVYSSCSGHRCPDTERSVGMCSLHTSTGYVSHKTG
jgi:DNA-binding NarL/FixJ family response regulator